MPRRTGSFVYIGQIVLIFRVRAKRRRLILWISRVPAVQRFSSFLLSRGPLQQRDYTEPLVAARQRDTPTEDECSTLSRARILGGTPRVSAIREQRASMMNGPTLTETIIQLRLPLHSRAPVYSSRLHRERFAYCRDRFKRIPRIATGGDLYAPRHARCAKRTKATLFLVFVAIIWVSRTKRERKLTIEIAICLYFLLSIF